MSITPERFELPRSQRLAVAVMGGLLLAVAAVAAWFAWHGIAGADDPRGNRIGLGALAALFGFIGLAIAVDARKGWRAAITLRDGGVEVERGEETPGFIGWGQIAGMKLRSASGGTAILGQGGETLFRVDNRIPGAPRLLHAILVHGVLPKRSPILPYHANQSVPRQIPAAIALVLGFGAFFLFANTPAAAKPAVLLGVGAVALAVAGVAALVSRFGGAGTVVVDADGITRGRAGTRTPWSSVEGAALVFVRGPKGERFARVALRSPGGRWEPLALQGADLVELLAAINAAAPGKVIAPPDEPLGATTRLAFSKNVTFRIGPPKQ